MKPVGAQQFEAAGSIHCLQTSDTKAFAKALLAANHARDKILQEVSLAGATWPMLLDLFVSQAHAERLSLSDIYNSIAAPKATTLRMIARLVDQGHLETAADPRDGRRTLVRLTDGTYRQMCDVVEEIRTVLLGSSANHDPHRSPCSSEMAFCELSSPENRSNPSSSVG